MDKIKTDKIILRKFGLLVAAVLFLVSLIIFAKRKYFMISPAAIACCFAVAAVFTPALLKYLYIFWARLARILNWVSTRLLLSLIFYLILSPVGLCLRLFRIDLLKRNLEPFKDSYWEPKSREPVNYLRQS
jgi:hypothetical protein